MRNNNLILIVFLALSFLLFATIRKQFSTKDDFPDHRGTSVSPTSSVRIGSSKSTLPSIGSFSTHSTYRSRVGAVTPRQYTTPSFGGSSSGTMTLHTTSSSILNSYGSMSTSGSSSAVTSGRTSRSTSTGSGSYGIGVSTIPTFSFSSTNRAYSTVDTETTSSVKRHTKSTTPTLDYGKGADRPYGTLFEVDRAWLSLASNSTSGRRRVITDGKPGTGENEGKYWDEDPDDEENGGHWITVTAPPGLWPNSGSLPPVGDTQESTNGKSYTWTGTEWIPAQSEPDQPIGDVPWMLMIALASALTLRKKIGYKKEQAQRAKVHSLEK